MSVDEKDTEQMEGKNGVKENEFEPSSPKYTIESDQATTEANTNIDEDQELKAFSENEVNEEKIVEVEDAAIKSLPRATINTHIGKKKKKNQPPLQKQQQQKKEIPIPNISKRLHQQSTEIKKIKSVLQSQSELIKQLKSQFKQVHKQILQIQKLAAKKRKIK
jgi:hypothetical protein